MKKLHLENLWGWSAFDEERNIDFNSVLIQYDSGHVVVDPLPLSAHNRAHLKSLGPVSVIVITNSDHVRTAVELAEETGAKILGPKKESETFPIICAGWLSDGDEIVPGLKVLEMQGSKTAGELALLLDEKTLITGDLVRSHQAGKLCLLPDQKLKDKALAQQSVQNLLRHTNLDAILTGDGWPVFRNARQVLEELVATF